MPSSTATPNISGINARLEIELVDDILFQLGVLHAEPRSLGFVKFGGQPANRH